MALGSAGKKAESLENLKIDQVFNNEECDEALKALYDKLNDSQCRVHERLQDQDTFQALAS